MADSLPSWSHAYQEREDLAAFDSAGLALFAMALKFGYDDLQTIGADAVVDGPDDRSCDVVYIDRDQRLAVVAQSYRATSPKNSANAGKAASLRQAISYLIEVDIDTIPDRIRPSAAALRAALQDGEIEQVHVWFVHNCPGSENVRGEMRAVEQTAHAIISKQFSDMKISYSLRK